MTKMRLLTLTAATLLTATFAASSPARAADHHGGWRAPSAVIYSFSYGYGPHYYRYFYSTVGDHHRYRHNARAYPRAYYYPRGLQHRYSDDFHSRRLEHGRPFRGERFADRQDEDHRFSRASRLLKSCCWECVSQSNTLRPRPRLTHAVAEATPKRFSGIRPSTT